MRTDFAAFDQMLALHLRVEHFYAEYMHTVDDDRLEDWPGLFTADGRYRVTTRENFDLGLPLALIYCDGRGMMEDRISALRTANIYEPHVYCHLTSATRVLDTCDGEIRARANFTVLRTMAEGNTSIFACGRYFDRLVEEDGRLRFASALQCWIRAKSTRCWSFLYRDGQRAGGNRSNWFIGGQAMTNGRSGDRTNRRMPRRQFLAGGGATVVAAFGSTRPARAQLGGTRVPAVPLTRPADIVFNNGQIITVDPASTIAQAIAIAGDRIIAVGPNEAMAPHVSSATRVIDLRGKTVVPGLTDGHAHMDREGLRNIFPSLGPVRSIRDIQDRISELARAKKPGEWIVTMPIGDPPFYLGLPDSLAEQRWPTRQELDAAAPNNPVYIRSIWGYWRGTFPLVSCANTAALQRAGITKNTVSPIETLTIMKDGNGDPTGVFIEREFAPVAELLWFREATRFSHADRVRALPQSTRTYNSVGTTSVFEGHGVATELLNAYKEVHRAGNLTARATLASSPNWNASGDASRGALIDGWAGWLGEPGLGDDWLKMGGLFAAIGRSRADEVRASAAPYTGWAGFNSDAGLPRDQLADVLLHCAANDIRVAAIAGAAGLGMLDLYEEVDRQIPLKGRRWVLAHIYVISPHDIERIARMGLVLTTHTNAALYKSLDATANALPPERHDDIVPLNALRQAGVTVSLATDNAPISLWGPVQQTIVRRDFKSSRQIGPKQALSRIEALRCATANGAYLTFDEDRKGTLEAGKFADLAVLSDDPLTIEETRIADIVSEATMVGGKIVFDRSNSSPH